MSKKLTYEFVKSEIEKTGYKLLSKEYVGANSQILVQCNKGHVYYVTWNAFYIGKRCSECYGNKKLKHKHVKIYIESFGYKLLSVYKNSRQKIKVQCTKDHIYKVTWRGFRQGNRCQICNFTEENHPNWKGGVKKKNIPLYATYAPQISFCEKVRRDPKNKYILQVKCTNSSCRKWFTPTRESILSRVKSVNKLYKGSSNFYCSDECKSSCSIFGQQLYPKGFTNTDSIRYDQTEWANLVKERDDYTCQRCGSIEDLVAHHIEGLNVNPIMSADIDLGVTLCKKCHNLVHSELGCRRIDLTKRSVCK